MATTVEFTSSVIEKISMEGADMRIKFSGATIQEVNNPDKAWKQAVDVYLKNVKIIGGLPELPVDLDDCYISVDLRPMSLAIPSEKQGKVELQLVFSSGALVLNSPHIQLTTVGEPIIA